MGAFTYYRPRSGRDLLRFKQERGEQAVLLAGGTNVMVYIKEGSIRQGILVDIASLSELKGIALQETPQATLPERTLAIGAGEPIADLLDSPLLGQHLPFFSNALKQFANPLVRNRATLGGNIADASPIGDTVPPLLCLEAQLLVASSAGKRLIPLEEFFTAPGRTTLQPQEVILQVLIPLAAYGRGVFLKLGLRQGTSCSVSSVAVWLGFKESFQEKGAEQRPADIRIACGGVAPVPLRARSTEQAFRQSFSNEPLSRERIRELSAELAREIRPISDVRGSAAYRSQVSGRLLAQALQKAVGLEV